MFSAVFVIHCMAPANVKLPYAPNARLLYSHQCEDLYHKVNVATVRLPN